MKEVKLYYIILIFIFVDKSLYLYLLNSANVLNERKVTVLMPPSIKTQKGSGEKAPRILYVGAKWR
jgi:hypothetical protein